MDAGKPGWVSVWSKMGPSSVTGRVEVRTSALEGFYWQGSVAAYSSQPLNTVYCPDGTLTVMTASMAVQVYSH